MLHIDRTVDPTKGRGEEDKHIVEGSHASLRESDTSRLALEVPTEKPSLEEVETDTILSVAEVGGAEVFAKDPNEEVELLFGCHGITIFQRFVTYAWSFSTCSLDCMIHPFSG